MSDYLLKVKVQNNKIIALMKQKGIETVSELHRLTNISQGVLGDLINMTASPLQGHSALSKKEGIQGNGLWRTPVLKLADFFGVLPDEMFNMQQLMEPLKTNKAERVMELEQVIALIGSKEVPLLEDSVFEEEKQKILDEALETLNPREKIALSKRYGLEDEPLTLNEAGKVLGVSQERMRQIEAKALRKLRHPSRANKLKQIDEEFIERNEYDYKTNVTFFLSESQKERLRKAYHANNFAWYNNSDIQDIHKASAAKYIDAYREELQQARKIANFEKAKQNADKKYAISLMRQLYPTKEH